MSKRSKSNRPKDCPYVGKGGLKLEFALEHFGIDVAGKTAADLGCNVGGFTDCLIQRGVAKIYAVDTSYGLLAWKLRSDERVIVTERTNALFWTPPEQVDFVVCDMGWTKQERFLPVVATLLKPGGEALSLLKPQYEAEKEWLMDNILPEERFAEVIEIVKSKCPPELTIVGEARSPYVGHGGNTEFWLWIKKSEG